MVQLSSQASSPSCPVVPWVSLVSSTKAPSRIEISRSAVAAMRASWVTMTSVCPDERRLSRSRSTSRVAALSRLPVGSSARTTSGSLLSARAIATRWRSPPESAEGRCSARSVSPTRSSSSAARRRADARRAPGQQRGQLHVLHGGELVHQVEGLEDEPDVGPPHPGQRLLAQLVDAAPRQPHLPGRRALQAAQQVQQRRLAATARPHHGERLARGDLQLDPIEGAHEARSLAVLLLQPARAQDRPHAQ